MEPSRGEILDLLMRITITAAAADYMLWKLGRHAGMQGLAAEYEPHTTIVEARETLKRCDLADKARPFLELARVN